MGIFSNMFGNSGQTQEFLDRGAVVVDVRTPAEFVGGHVTGSYNIPLDRVEDEIERIKGMNKPVVLCCASGARSGQATSFLRKQGLDCCNGGGWMSVNRLV